MDHNAANILAKSAFLGLLALAACAVNVQTHQVVQAPLPSGAVDRAALAETHSRDISPEEAAAAGTKQSASALAALVNTWRQKNGLPAVPVSPLLTRVAAAHVGDMASQPDGGLSVLKQTDPKTGLECSPHSWSDKGPWTAVCFTGDNRYALAMWSKPREITKGAYSADGIEVGAWDTLAITPAIALESWQRSPAHKAVILEQGPWEGSNWKAMGVAIGGHFAYVWFGKEPDPDAR